MHEGGKVSSIAYYIVSITLILRKILQELLNKNFIQISNSLVATLVLFAYKLDSGLQFCTNYRALNIISKKNRYPLLLINETLERIRNARQFTKLNVIVAFHKIRIEKGQEQITIFCARFRLFKWLITPFSLMNAPSTFQCYINQVLRDFLNKFASAYLDDILVFLGGSLADY